MEAIEYYKNGWGDENWSAKGMTDDYFKHQIIEAFRAGERAIFEKTTNCENTITAANKNIFKYREVTNNKEVENQSYVVKIFEYDNFIKNIVLVVDDSGLSFEEVQKRLRAWISNRYKVNS
jgi:hypothetical protein